ELHSNWKVIRQVDGESESVKATYTGSHSGRIAAIDRIRQQLRRYTYYPVFYPVASTVSVHWYSARTGKQIQDHWSAHYDDASAVFDLAQLADLGLLDRLATCRCGRWFFARFAHQRFCSAKCREQDFRTSDQWKEYRRRKAREYYRL